MIKNLLHGNIKDHREKWIMHFGYVNSFLLQTKYLIHLATPKALQRNK